MKKFYPENLFMTKDVKLNRKLKHYFNYENFNFNYILFNFFSRCVYRNYILNEASRKHKFKSNFTLSISFYLSLYNSPNE